MRKEIVKKGFTIIEVALFLAISGAIFAMIMTNTSRTVARRRYNDSVNDVVEEIRNAYSAAINVENYRQNTEDASFWCSATSAYQGGFHVDSSAQASAAKKTDNYPGRTRCAVYGQLITFGENRDKSRGSNSDMFRYTIIGRAVEKDIEPGDGDEVLNALKEVGANVVTMLQKNNNMTSCVAAPAGNWTTHSLQWTGRIENRHDRNLYNGAIMIARSPISATVHTYIYSGKKNTSLANQTSDTTFDIQAWLAKTGVAMCNSAVFQNASSNFIMKAINNGQWIKDQDLDICVGSEDDLYAVGYKRRAIRIHGDGSTESAVELLPETEVDKDNKLICDAIKD
jgi:type II secretory pathway pseudopilin PulG